MLNEAKIIFDKIKDFRFFLTEGVGNNVIIDAIDKQEYLYLYYNGDDNVEKGFRTVRPMVLGTTSAGNTVLRAWQDKGRSQSLGAHAKRAPRPPAPRGEHERWTDTDGSQKPGWRLFRVDKISKIYPIGDRFVDNDGKVLIPPKYREGGDDQMGGGIIAYVSTQPAQTTMTNVGDMDKPKVVSKPDKQVAEPKGRWKDFVGVDISKRPMTPETIQKIYDYAVNVRKERTDNLFIALDKHNRYKLKLEKYRDRFPRESIIGNVKELYDDLVLKNRQKTASEDDFIRKEMEKFNQGIQNENNEHKTFFKEKK